MINQNIFKNNKKLARKAGYRVESSMYGHVALNVRHGWFSKPFKESAEEAWLHIFDREHYPSCDSNKPNTPKYSGIFNIGVRS